MKDYKLRDLRASHIVSLIVYYESIKREPKIRGIYECRCDERLQTKSKEFTRLAYTMLCILTFSLFFFSFSNCPSNLRQESILPSTLSRY